MSLDKDELLKVASKVLPPEALQLIAALPDEEAVAALQKLVQQSGLQHLSLTKKHVKRIERKCEEFGFKTGDVDFSDVGKDNCIFYGACDEDDLDSPVAFVLANVHASSKSLVLTRSESGAAMDALFGGTGNWQQQAPAVTLLALGVSYQYRRQGLATQLMESLTAVASQLGAIAILLQVSEQNPGAAAFYAALGYKDTGLSLQRDNGTFRLLGAAVQPAMDSATAGGSTRELETSNNPSGGNSTGSSSSSSSNSKDSRGSSSPSKGRGFGGSSKAQPRRRTRAMACSAVAAGTVSYVASTSTHVCAYSSSSSSSSSSSNSSGSSSSNSSSSTSCMRRPSPMAGTRHLAASAAPYSTRACRGHLLLHLRGLGRSSTKPATCKPIAATL